MRLGSQFDEGLWQQWPSPSTEICFWHITALTIVDTSCCCCCCSKVLRRHMAHRPSTSFISVLYNLAKWLLLYSVYFSSLFFSIFFLWPTGSFIFLSQVYVFLLCSSFLFL